MKPLVTLIMTFWFRIAFISSIWYQVCAFSNLLTALVALCRSFLLFNLYFAICPAGHSVNFSSLNVGLSNFPATPRFRIEFVCATFPSDSPISHRVHSGSFNLLQLPNLKSGSSAPDSTLGVPWLRVRFVLA